MASATRAKALKNLRGSSPWLAWAGVALLAAAFVVNTIVALPIAQGLEVEVDKDAEQTYRLAEQVLESTKTLLGLGTGVLGLLGFLFSDKISSYWERSGPYHRQAVLIGAAMACVSIATGLVTLWATITMSAAGVMRHGLDRLALLQTVQIGELGFALLLVAVVAVVASSDSPTPVSPGAQ
jgi:hypothetical protein